jgi:hypothetical protein
MDQNFKSSPLLSVDLWVTVELIGMDRENQNELNAWKVAFARLRRQALSFQTEIKSLRSQLRESQAENLELKTNLRSNGSRTYLDPRARAEPTEAEKFEARENARKQELSEHRAQERIKRWSNPLLEIARAEVRLMQVLDTVVADEYRTLNKGAQVVGPVPDSYCKTNGYPAGCQLDVPADPKERARYLFLVTAFGRIKNSEKDLIVIGSKAQGSVWEFQNEYESKGVTFSEDALRAAIQRSRQTRASILSALKPGQRSTFLANARERLENAPDYDDFSPNQLSQILQDEETLVGSISGGRGNVHCGGRFLSYEL